MEFKTLVFYLAILFFFLRFNPFLPFDFSVYDRPNLIGYVSGAYIAAFLLYEFILNYDKIKEILAKGQNSMSVKLVDKSKNQKRDLLKFFILSLLIFLSIDIIFTKISNQSIYQYFINYVPGMKETLGILSLQPDILNPSNILKPNGLSFDPKFGNIKEGLSIFIGPTLGAIILFALRQLNNRSRYMKENKHPGARILLLFLSISMIILVVDISRDQSEFSQAILISNINDINPYYNYLSLDNNTTSSENSRRENITTTPEDRIVSYEIENLIAHFIKLSFSSSFIISIISIWFFDWHLFSKLWEQK